MACENAAVDPLTTSDEVVVEAMRRCPCPSCRAGAVVFDAFSPQSGASIEDLATLANTLRALTVLVRVKVFARSVGL